MRVSLNWLKEFVDVNMSPEELGRVLTIAEFELEELIDLRSQADGVVVGKVIERSPATITQSISHYLVSH